MATITRIEEIEIWQLAREYARLVRTLLRDNSFRFEFGLKEQLKNSSGSIMDNIAEGFGRGGKHEFVNYLTIAKGSAEESKSQLYRCFDDGLIQEPIFLNLLTKQKLIIQKITTLIKYLNQAVIKGQKFKDRV